MRISILILAVSVSFRCVQSEEDTVPVLIVDQARVLDCHIEPNPFAKVSPGRFADIIHEAISKSAVVIMFIEELFSVEDISSKDGAGSPFMHLQAYLHENRLKYLPRVVDPYKTLCETFPQHRYNVLQIGRNTKISMQEEHLKYFYVFFRDSFNGNGTDHRTDSLRSHDSILSEMLFAVGQFTRPTVAFYTGRRNPVVVGKVGPAPLVAKDPSVQVVTDGALFRFVGVYSDTHSRRALFHQSPVLAKETWTADTLSTKMAYTDFELEFNFSFKDTDWMLDTVSLLEGGEEVGRTLMLVGAQWDWAFYCGEPLVVTNTRDGSSVTISEYKIQPLRHRRRHRGKARPLEEEEGGEDSEPSPEVVSPEPPSKPSQSDGFGKTVHCGPYMSLGITACLMVVGITMVFLSLAVTALFNCKSNDRFDEAQSKQVSLGVER